MALLIFTWPHRLWFAGDCFPDTKDNETDYSPISRDDAGDSLGNAPDNNAYNKTDDALNDAGAWLLNQEEGHSPEYYLAEEADLNF